MRSVLINAALMILRQIMDKRIIEALSKLVVGYATSPVPGAEKRTQVLSDLRSLYQYLEPAMQAAGSALINAALELLVARLKARAG